MTCCQSCKKDPFDCNCKNGFVRADGIPPFPYDNPVKFGIIYRNKATGQRLKMTMGASDANHFILTTINESIWEGTAQELMELWEPEENEPQLDVAQEGRAR